jgi:hypothetical protein
MLDIGALIALACQWLNARSANWIQTSEDMTAVGIGGR